MDKQFPDGKMNARDEGATQLAVGTENGRVKVTFAKPVAWIGLPPQGAVQLAMLLMKHAQALGAGTLTIEIPGPGPGEQVN